ncbi:RagB/SusD family nutrient uptake outer membrane protein [Membranihabitans marinus]|uniref:RagB/SusD family nutrient uptake outer membrane protein n=1 Tax=Membranihabitans marinus TaxID=1227546 RepID=UPI001F3B9372|nr:RagB/SusD family nutrient uptake outer membrane protein [Membranihabitans marinus]
MKNSNKILLSLFVLVFLGSCNNPLEEDIYSFISTENFYKNADDADAAIEGIYSGLDGDAVYGRWFYDLVHLMDDQVTIHRNPLFLQMDDFNFTPDHPYLNEFWAGMYSVIKYANVAINRIPDIEMEVNLKNSYIGEARFLRANMYFNLVRLWGSVPLIVEEVLDESSAIINKETISDIYDIITSDLIFAEENLPSTRPSVEFGRVTSGAAKAMLTDVYLTQEKYVEAAAKAEELINTGNYSLLENYSDIFSSDNEHNPEIIYSIVFDGINSGNWMASFSHVGGTDNANCANGAQVWQVEEESEMWQSWDNQDLRRQFSVYDEYLSKDGTYKSVYNTSRPYPGFGKWNAPGETGVSSCPINPILYRYADVLLMYAEATALANGGPNQDAYDAVNMVRRRGYGLPINESSNVDLPTGLSQSEFRDAVILERSHEFVVEGKRLFDLLRTGVYPQILESLGKNINPNAKLFPIPSAEIDANAALSMEDQNPGY